MNGFLFLFLFLQLDGNRTTDQVSFSFTNVTRYLADRIILEYEDKISTSIHRLQIMAGPYR